MLLHLGSRCIEFSSKRKDQATLCSLLHDSRDLKGYCPPTRLPLHVDTSKSELCALSTLVFRCGAASQHRRISINTDRQIILDDRFKLERAGLESGHHLGLGLDLTKLIHDGVVIV